MYPTVSVAVSDQKASFGGRCPGGKCRRYACSPLSFVPALSTPVVQYAASSNELTTGRAFCKAARTNSPLSGRPALRIELQPLTVVVSAFATESSTRIVVRNARVAPMITPCTTPELAIQERMPLMRTQPKEWGRWLERWDSNLRTKHVASPALPPTSGGAMNRGARDAANVGDTLRERVTGDPFG